MSSKTSNALTNERRLLKTTTSPALVLTLLLLTGACIPKKSCEFTKTCAAESNTDASAVTAQATQSDGAAAAGSGDGAAGTGDASTENPDGAPPVISCTRSTQCTDEVPYCDEAAQVCTGCRSSTDCRSDEQPFCLIDSDAPQANRCVQCLAGDGTCAGACVDNQCATCDPTNNAGCSDTTPFCVTANGAPSCVDCVEDQDCASTPSTPFCSHNQCQTCSTDNPDSCPPEAPVCVEEEAAARCVECADSSHCASLTDGGSLAALCVQERCTTCVLGTNAGCSTTDPFCAAVVPNDGDGGFEYLAPLPSETPASNQYLEYDHVCLQCLNDDACGGSLPGCFDGQCVQCTENAHCKDPRASVCDTASHTCVGCQAIGECSHQPDTSACDIDNRVCVACTAAEDTCADKACRTVPGDGQYTCSSANKGQTAPCFPCVSDSACLPDSKCVQESYAGAERGWRCFWQETRLAEDNECGDNRVFTIPFSASSVDGESGNYCTLRLSSCEGYRDFGTGPVTNDNGQPTCTSHDDCGLPDTDDGFCIPATSNNRCTYDCLSNQDCDSPLQCATQTGVDQTQAKVCLLNP